MKLRESKEFYERYHRKDRSHPIEEIKQDHRIRTIHQLLPRAPGEVLFVGCGRGRELELVSSRPVAIDLAISGLLSTASRVDAPKACQADACSLPFHTGSFDTVICSEVIEHISAAEAAIAEISRVLRRGGTLVLSPPNYWSLFGMARIVGEALTGRPITSGNQPYDRWATPPRLSSLLKPHFEIIRTAGSWFFPPFGRGARQITPRLTVPLVRFLRPVEMLLSRFLPWLGHIIIVLATPHETRT